MTGLGAQKKANRQKKLLEEINLDPGIMIRDLAAKLNVSRETIRRDFDALCDSGQLQRRYGGAVVIPVGNVLSFEARQDKHVPERKAIARKAHDLLQDEQVIMLSPGTTALLLALELAETEKRLTVITNGIREALTLVNNLINKSTQHFSVHYGENLPEIAGHYQRLEQVVINLIQNACQALSNDEESISLTTYYDKVNKTIHLEVKDEGIGISEQQLPRITDPFFTTKRDSGGLGLGLSISSSIIIEHSGHLKFMPNLKKGTLVKLSLPAIQA